MGSYSLQHLTSESPTLRIVVMATTPTTGDRVRLIYTNDQYTMLRSGDEGTVGLIDDMGTIHVSWDNGSRLGLIPGVDIFVVLN